MPAFSLPGRLARRGWRSIRWSTKRELCWQSTLALRCSECRSAWNSPFQAKSQKHWLDMQLIRYTPCTGNHWIHWLVIAWVIRCNSFVSPSPEAHEPPRECQEGAGESHEVPPFGWPVLGGTNSVQWFQSRWHRHRDCKESNQRFGRKLWWFVQDIVSSIEQLSKGFTSAVCRDEYFQILLNKQKPWKTIPKTKKTKRYRFSVLCVQVMCVRSSEGKSVHVSHSLRFHLIHLHTLHL